MRICVLYIVSEQKLHEQVIGSRIPLRLTVVMAVDYPCALWQISCREVYGSVRRDVIFAGVNSLNIAAFKGLPKWSAGSAAGVFEIYYAVAAILSAACKRRTGAGLY